MEATGDPGMYVEDLVLWISGLPKAEAAPGWVVIGLSALSFFPTAWMWISTAHFLGAVEAARTIVAGGGRGGYLRRGGHGPVDRLSEAPWSIAPCDLRILPIVSIGDCFRYGSLRDLL